MGGATQDHGETHCRQTGPVTGCPFLAASLKFAGIWADSFIRGNAFDKELLELYPISLRIMPVHAG
jgi:hypothetical protein